MSAVTESTETFEIEAYFPNASYTGYGLIKQTNLVLADLGIDKVLPGPMGYTYLKKGYVTGSKDVKSCSGTEAASWASKYVAKLVAKVTESVQNEADEQYKGFENE